MEDANVSREELAQEFGNRVAELVAAVSEKKKNGEDDIPWAQRKLQQLQHLEQCDLEVAQLKAADVLHNLTTITTDLRLIGDDLWKRFNAGKTEQVWYYSTLVKMLSKKLGPHGLSAEMQDALHKLTAVCPPEVPEEAADFMARL